MSDDTITLIDIVLDPELLDCEDDGAQWCHVHDHYIGMDPSEEDWNED